MSDTAPMTMVVRAAVTALAITMAEMSAGVAWNILYMNTLKYMFSTTQATWPIRPKMIMAVQNLVPSFV